MAKVQGNGGMGNSMNSNGVGRVVVSGTSQPSARPTGINGMAASRAASGGSRNNSAQSGASRAMNMAGGNGSVSVGGMRVDMT